MISCSQTRYKHTWNERAVDKRADAINGEYIKKARKADQHYGGIEPGVIGPVEQKLLSFDAVQGLIFGNFGECSEGVHTLVKQLATSRVRVNSPQVTRRGVVRTEEGEKSMVVSSIRRQISVAAVKAQCSSLLGRLESLGPGVAAAQGRRKETIELDRRLSRERQAHRMSIRQGRNIIRRGFAMLA